MSPIASQMSPETDEHPENPGEVSDLPLSATGRELMKLKVVQKASQVYDGVTDLCGVTRGIARTVELTSSGVCSIVLKTRPGQKADEVMASIAKTVGKAEEKCMAWAPGQGKEEKESEVKQDKEGQGDGEENPDAKPDPEAGGSSLLLNLFVVPIHLFFRFFPPSMLFRWFVHGAFMLSQATAALCKDLARPDDWRVTKRVEKLPEPVEVPTTDEAARPADSKSSDGTDGTNTEAQQPNPENQPESSQEVSRPTTRRTSARRRSERPVKTMGFIDRAWETFCENLYAIFYLIDVFVLIPYFEIQTYALEFLDDVLYWLAGIEDSEEDKKDKLQVKRLLRKKAEKIARKKWIVDATIDSAVGQLMRLPVVGFCLCVLGVKRPVTPFQNLYQCLRTERRRTIDLAHYLRDDPNYDESNDPDYVPGYCSEDSFEYKDDEELEADIPVEATS